MTHTPIKQNTVSLTLSCLITTICFAMPLTATADTSSSIDAIMEQMKSFKPPTPKVSTPEPTFERTEPKVEVKRVEAPVKIEEKPIEAVTSSVYVAPPEIEKQQAVITHFTQPVRAKSRKVTKKKRKSKKRRVRRQVSTTTKASHKVSNKASNKGSAVDYKGFDERYMSLIYDILNEKEPTSSATKAINIPEIAVTSTSKFAGTSGWIYLGKYNRGRWLGAKSLKSGNSLPVAGQQYAVKSPLLNLRKNRPSNKGLGKLVQVLRVGDQVQVIRVHRSSKNNYWANIVRP